MNEKPQMTAGEEDMVRRALQSYHFTDPEISFIRHNENITCRVTEDGERYVLRIRNPVEGFSLKLLGGRFSGGADARRNRASAASFREGSVSRAETRKKSVWRVHDRS